VLEGGYDLQGLAASAGFHVQALMHGTGQLNKPLADDETKDDLQ
jgi:hypothetical protein